MKTLQFLVLLAGGLTIAGCPLGAGGGEDQEEYEGDIELTVAASPSDAGTVARSPSQKRYMAQSEVTLTANPANGYALDRWEGDVTGSANPTTITMYNNATVTAVFAPGHRLTVAASPSIGGTVSPGPGKTDYKVGSKVKLTANPASCYEFTRWEGDATGSVNPTAITMDSDKTVTAVFAPATTPLIGLSTASVKILVRVDEHGPYSIQPTNMATEITNIGIDTLSGLDYSFPDGAPAWLSAELSGSTAPATLTVQLKWSELQQQWSSHPYPSTRIAITSASANNSPQYVGVAIGYCPTISCNGYGPIYVGHSGAPPAKVICAELHRQGLMDEAIWKADEAFGNYLKENQRDVLLGYQLWAKTVVKWMQKSETVTRVVDFFAKPWSYEMAYRMGARDKGSFAGRILMDVGVPICGIIGRSME